MKSRTVILQSLPKLAHSSAIILIMSGCGGGDSSDSSSRVKSQKSTLISQTAISQNNTVTDLTAIFKKLTPAQQSIPLVGTAKCDINVSRIRFSTTGAKGEAAESTAAVFTPTGSNPACSGKRPLLLHSHGTAVNKAYDFSQITDDKNEATLRSSMFAAMFAGQGYIVVAPNYIGYGGSSLDYNAYLVGTQQSQEMSDALSAAREALPDMSDKVSDSGKLFLSGYSQGGYVAMATAQKLQNEGESISGVVPMSGPYALTAFGDAIFAGNVNAGGTIFGPLMTKAYQVTYGNIYKKPSDLYAQKYADSIESLLPSDKMFEELYTTGSIPLALFQSAPTGIAALDKISPADPRFRFGFSADNYLMNSAYRAGYLADAQKHPDGLVPTVTAKPFASKTTEHPFRQALAKNDLRTYIPNIPIMLCGGNQDPTVFYGLNADTMTAIWKGYASNGYPLKVAKIDVDITNQKDNTFESFGLANDVSNAMQSSLATLQGVFATEVQTIAATAGQAAATQVIQNGGTQQQATTIAQAAGTQAVAASYHAIVAPYCAAAARDFFNEL